MCNNGIVSAIEFLHKKFGKYLQPGGEEGDLTGVVTGEKHLQSTLKTYKVPENTYKVPGSYEWMIPRNEELHSKHLKSIRTPGQFSI